MASQVLSVHSSEDVDQAEHLMAEGQVHRLPVLDDEQQLIGVVSMNDLARLAVRAHKHGVDREFVRTLAAVCQPRASTPLAQVTGPVASN
jgi:CBS-domain-containing membrane protein